jgi:hypothetical protein
LQQPLKNLEQAYANFLCQAGRVPVLQIAVSQFCGKWFMSIQTKRDLEQPLLGP